ncbi:conjugal transfer protein TraH [Rhizobium sp. 1399]|uniref:conjugal transfer protein TraH n=1 Tax=Rhizobium sp. 1399 TaxID=2817758 RepID=UPI002858DCF7|nr:conjugal transfer protein TraH [Rhizobium sp. 1399]MDR6671211.1 hypothetical protein [Rhizobium sp. 1399]
MIDADFIKQCADPRLSVEIVQQFVQEIGAPDHLQVTVKSGNRTFAVPKPATAEEALDLTKKYVGQAVVRVGLTQYPAGIGIKNADELSLKLFDSCENLRMGTAMFSKIYRIATKFYGNPRPEAFEDAMLSYASGYYEGENVFYAEDPGDVAVWKQAPGTQEGTGENEAADPVGDVMAAGAGEGGQLPADVPAEDPNRATMRINLSGIKDHNVEVGPASK